MRALTAQILIRTIACSKLNKDKRLIKFAAGPNGKPYIDNEDNFTSIYPIRETGLYVQLAIDLLALMWRE